MSRVLPVTEPVATLDDYLDIGGGAGIMTALDHGPDWVLEQVRKAGLRGRDGAGLPVAEKWSAVRDTGGYVVGNAADGEPGTFKDRYILRRNPYQVLEGLAIAAMCAGVSRAFIVIDRRFEQEIAVLISAGCELRQAGLLGDVPVQLLLRPDEYLLGVQSVETFAHVPEILRLGADEFRESGTEFSPGTTVFTISGDVRRPGVAELPLGFPLRALIELTGGGVMPGRRVKAVFPGGSGAPLAEEQLDIPLDFDSIRAAGSALGSAGFVVYDDSACIVAATLMFALFLAVRSQCPVIDSITRCLRRIECGIGTARDLETVVAKYAPATFRAEFEAHLGRACPLPRELPVPRILDFDEKAGRLYYDEPNQLDWTFADEPGLSA